MSTTLKPCPFCGKAHTLKISTASAVLWDEEEQGYPYPHSESYTVACDASKPGGPGGCGATSGYFPTEGEAVASWNRRDGIAEDAAPQEQSTEAERFCDTHCCWSGHHPECHLAGGDKESVREQAVAYWECRSFDIEHGVWFPWGRVEGSARYPLEQRLADIRAKIAEGSRWELRALYASPLPADPTDEQINKAFALAYPADQTSMQDRRVIARALVAALHQAHQKGGA